MALGRVQQLFLGGHAAQAEHLAREIVAAQPSSSAALNVLALVLKGRGSLEEAEAAMRRAVSLQPQDAALHNNLGNILRSRRDAAGAEQAYRRALALTRDYAEAYHNLGIVLAEQGRNEEALAAERRTLALKPDYPEAAFELGNALTRAHREAEALEAYRCCAALAPRFLPAHRAYSLLAATLGELDRIGETYAAARHALGDDPDLLLAEAALRLRLDEPGEAEHLARRAGNRADAAVLIAQALAAQSRFGEAIALLEQATKSETVRIVAHRELGIALLKTGEAARAADVLEAGHRLAPADQLILAYLTTACREADVARYAALVDFEKCIGLYEVPVEGLAPVLERLHTARAAPLDQTLRGGTQTSGSLFAEPAPEIAALREAIRARVGEYICALPEDVRHPFLGRRTNDFAFSGSWSCRLSSSGYHTNHVHQEGWISSACYIALPPAVAQGEQGWLTFGQSNLMLGPRDVPAVKVQPTVGKLVLFPSYFWHGTLPFSDTVARLTVAFDVVPR